jgi:hypothetical protein
VYGRSQLVANKADRLIALLAILLSNCRHNQQLMIVKYFCTQSKRNTVPRNIGGIFSVSNPIFTKCNYVIYIVLSTKRSLATQGCQTRTQTGVAL